MAGITLNELSACELRKRIGRGETSCVEVVHACLERIAARDGSVHAWVWLDPDAARAQAKQLDACGQPGQLHGVPLGIKDVIDTFDMPTQMGSSIYRGHRPPADAACAALARRAGALIVGKTVTCEFAGATAAETTNPHDVRRTPGGSSSGSAAAVADFMVPLAVGTQTGGSILRPAAFCGIVGFKPSFGSVNTAGVKPAAASLDTVGYLARTVEDVALAMRATASLACPRWLPDECRLRIGLCRTPFWDSARPEAKAALLDSGQRLEQFGHRVIEVDLPSQFNLLSDTREIINDFERARGLAHEWASHRGQISVRLAASVQRGLALSAEDYYRAMRQVLDCRAQLDRVFAPVDVLVAPTTDGEAPEGLENTGDHRFQSLWTQLHVPALHLPTHVGPNGMPVGIQLVATSYADRALLAAAQLVLRTLGQGSRC